MLHFSAPNIASFCIFATFSILFFSLFCANLVNAREPNEFFPRRVYAYQREIIRPESHQKAGISGGTGKKGNDQVICMNGKLMHRRCVCNLDYFGDHCERKMFCRGYERARNGTCVLCDRNYSGDLCDHPKCKNGGIEDKYEQKCECPQPHSGPFCELLKVEDVYRFYNTKAALVGPLGILTVIPMLICFYMCEKKARIRQVGRIQKSWSEQRKASIQSAHIAHLLAEV